VPEPGAIAADDHGALVTDQRIVKAGGLEGELHRPHHAPGDDNHVKTGVVGASQRRDRPRPQDAVLPDERAVEVGRDDAYVARKVVG